MSATELNPDSWLVSTHQAMTTYVRNKIDNYILDGITPVGLQAYEIVFDFPDANDMEKSAELPKTIIHFGLDDINNIKLGIGDDIAGRIETPDPGPGPDHVTLQEGQCHVLNYDVGVWASDQSGGVSARMAVYEILQKMFGAESGRRAFREATNIEIRSFNGGRNIIDRISDVRVYRIIDCELIVRVYSRVTSAPIVIVDQEPVVTGILNIDGTPIS